MRRAAPWVAGLAALACTVAEAQQVVEVDFEAGRTIIDDEWRSMFHHDLAVDWARNILYVRDDEEPEGIMAFSLETGEWIRTIPTPTGDGPQELTHGFRGRGHRPRRRGLCFRSAEGHRVRCTRRVCPQLDAGGADERGRMRFRRLPGSAHPGRSGAAWFGWRRERRPPFWRTAGRSRRRRVDDGVSISRRLMSSRIACSEDVAYVVSSYDTGPDSVFTYRRGDEEGRIAVPTDFIEEDCVRAATVNGVTLRRECPVWSERLRPSFDDLGNLVLFGNDKTVQGAIINPETGCYAMVRTPFKPDPSGCEDPRRQRPGVPPRHRTGVHRRARRDGSDLRQFGHRPDDEPSAPGQRRAVFGDAVVGGVSVRRTLHRRFLTM